MILEMFPETGAVEIICPVKEANLLAERTKSESIILSMVLVILATLLSTISMVPRALSQVIPNQSSLWQGIHTDLSSLVTKPALKRSVLTASLDWNWNASRKNQNMFYGPQKFERGGTHFSGGGKAYAPREK